MKKIIALASIMSFGVNASTLSDYVEYHCGVSSENSEACVEQITVLMRMVYLDGQTDALLETKKSQEEMMDKKMK